MCFSQQFSVNHKPVTLWSWPDDHICSHDHEHRLTIKSDMWPSYIYVAFFSRVAGRGDGCGTCYMALPQMSQAGLLFAYISLQDRPQGSPLKGPPQIKNNLSVRSITFSLTL